MNEGGVDHFDMAAGIIAMYEGYPNQTIDNERESRVYPGVLIPKERSHSLNEIYRKLISLFKNNLPLKSEGPNTKNNTNKYTFLYSVAFVYPRT